MAEATKQAWTHRGANWIERLYRSQLYTGKMSRHMAEMLFRADFRNHGCRHFGSADCLHCELAAYMPRADCNPPEECAACPARERCPCGSREYKNQLLKD